MKKLAVSALIALPLIAFAQSGTALPPAPQPVASPMPQAAPQPAAPPTPQAAPQPVAPPAPQAAPQPMAPPVPAQAQPSAPPQYAPPAPNPQPPQYAPPQAVPQPPPSPPQAQPGSQPPQYAPPPPQAYPQYAPPPPQYQYAPPPQGYPQYAPPPPQYQYAPPPQGYPQYAYPPPPQGYPQYAYPPPPQGAPQYAYPPPQGGPQYYPPPQGYYPPPQGHPAPQPPAPARREHQRDSWYIGFRLGGGDGNVRTADRSYTFERYIGKSPTTLAIGLQVGATLTPKLLLGFEISGVSSGAEEGSSSVTVMVHNYNLMATFFPMERGFFLRGGGGLSKFTLDVENVNGMSGSDSVSGTNLTGAIGYAWWLGQHFNLTANLDYSHQWYRGNEPGQPKRADYWALALGFDWY